LQLHVLAKVRPSSLVSVKLSKQQKSPFHGDSGTASNTMCHWTPRVYLPKLSNGLNKMHRCDRETDDRETDHVTEKYVAIGVIACATKAIPFKNWQVVKIHKKLTKQKK